MNNLEFKQFHIFKITNNFKIYYRIKDKKDYNLPMKK